ncbi:DNA translocase FtsK [Candidatus Paraluminiphilus aquimaris]|uniref:DNA translocase FtsK n=1 Tax=Candidatus Paraluminiphilus aquimaris TaxID=2518994 RepID=A0ABY6Q8B8_9GAMM|nr:DNA translocase FtsK [Candidatus Paraluminiphilus aquimaris]
MPTKNTPSKVPQGDTEASVPGAMASVGFIAGLAGASFALVSLLTFSTSDPSWSSSGAGDVLSNQGGVVGAYFSDMVYSLVGFLALGVPLLLLLLSYRSIRPVVSRGVTSTDRVISSFGWVTFLAASAGLIQIVVPQEAFLPQGTGGIIGYGVASWFTAAFSDFGARLLLSFCVLLGGTLAFDIDWMRVAEKLGSVTINTMNTLRSRIDDFNDRRKLRTEKAKRSVQIAAHVEKEKLRTPPKIKAPKLLENVGKKAEREKQKPLFESAELTPMPPLALLDAPTQTGPRGYSTSELESLSRLLEIKLADFGITAEVVSVYPGPVVTRFEIQPAAGVKVSRISNLAKDLARSLAVNSVRVVEVIHGKSVVGIEIPNADRQTVNFRDVLSSAEFDDAKSPLTIALGHDIAGTPIVADLGKMPHVLVAGTTGSGKSVGVNCMLVSLLYKATPDDVRLILVDPKMLELSVYDGIPHLLTPVITDMKDAANGLRWCVAEMERRYKLMSLLGVRNLAGYNRKVRDAEKAGTPIDDPLWTPDPVLELTGEEQVAPALETLPSIVVVIDEFADMMMIVGKKVEELIARIAQKARAAGIHLVLATQRPSVDVITGLIKANIPSRVAFSVSSKIDSRTILDQGGAEQLLGYGDMLYLPSGSSTPTRVHGAFCSDDEVHRVVADWRRRGTPEFIEGLLDEGGQTPVTAQELQSAASSDDDPESDALYDEAVHYVCSSRRASISSVQRKLRIGYNRAARLIETMEATGVVSAMGSNGQREVLAPPPPGGDD